MKLEGLSLSGLIEIWNTEWKKDVPEFESDSSLGHEWDREVKRAIRTASEMDLIEALHLMKDDEYFEPRLWMLEALREAIVGNELLEKLAQMKTTLTVLMKQQGRELANITVEQLNRLKGGLPIQ